MATKKRGSKKAISGEAYREIESIERDVDLAWNAFHRLTAEHLAEATELSQDEVLSMSPDKFRAAFKRRLGRVVSKAQGDGERQAVSNLASVVMGMAGDLQERISRHVREFEDE